MTIETSNLSSAVTVVDSALHGVAEIPATVISVPGAQSTAGAATRIDAATLKAAQQQLQAYISGQTNPPHFTVDYLSGLGVMTVRAAITGDVVFQIPDMQAVRLAQLLKEGAPVESLGILNTVA